MQTASCYRPFFIKDGNGKQVLVPCNKCPRCKAKRVSSWSFRLMEEVKRSTSAYFITLTYNDTNKPITKNGFDTLSRRDLQLFFKRLRKEVIKRSKAQPVRYFAAGEYGGKIGRPHYHIILYNAQPKEISKAWSYPRAVYTAHRLRRQTKVPTISGYLTATHRVKKTMQSASLGHVHYGSKKGVTGASCGYTLKYILKPKDEYRSIRDDSQEEFILMSKGLGSNYITPAMVRYHHADLNNRMYVNLPGNKKAAMPRYYKDRIYTTKEREEITKAARAKMAEAIFEQFMQLSAKEYTEEQHNKEQGIQASFRKQHSLTNQIHTYVKDETRVKRTPKIQNKRKRSLISTYLRGERSTV